MWHLLRAGYLDILYFVPATSLLWSGTVKPVSEMGGWRLQEVSWLEISVLLLELWFELQSKLLPMRCSLWRGEWCEGRRSSLVRFEGGEGEALILERTVQVCARYRKRRAGSVYFNFGNHRFPGDMQTSISHASPHDSCVSGFPELCPLLSFQQLTSCIKSLPAWNTLNSDSPLTE